MRHDRHSRAKGNFAERTAPHPARFGGVSEMGNIARERGSRNRTIHPQGATVNKARVAHRIGTATVGAGCLFGIGAWGVLCVVGFFLICLLRMFLALIEAAALNCQAFGAATRGLFIMALVVGYVLIKGCYPFLIDDEEFHRLIEKLSGPQ